MLGRESTLSPEPTRARRCSYCGYREGGYSRLLAKLAEEAHTVRCLYGSTRSRMNVLVAITAAAVVLLDKLQKSVHR
jgi:hypothetical protein